MMKISRWLLAVLLLAVILGLGAIPVRAHEGSIPEDIIITDFDPSDDIYGGQIVLMGQTFGWSYTAHGLAAAFGLLVSELETATGALLTNLTGGN